jgi:hypothetical protein
MSELIAMICKILLAYKSDYDGIPGENYFHRSLYRADLEILARKINNMQVKLFNLVYTDEEWSEKYKDYFFHVHNDSCQNGVGPCRNVYHPL